MNGDRTQIAQDYTGEQEIESCGNCHFARHAIKNGQIDLTQLQCKHDTPKVYTQITSTGMQFVVARPGTQRNEWCGQWKAKQ